MNGRGLHHVEVWVPDLGRAVASWGWLLGALGYELYQDWPAGRSWRAGDHYIVVEQSSDLTALGHDRCRPGLNHLAFHAGGPEEVDRLVTDASEHGWFLLFPDRHPHAGGPDYYAAYLEDRDGFEIELVGRPTPTARRSAAHAPRLETERLVLVPLAVSDAEEMLGVLGDPELYHFIGGEPPTPEELRSRYRRLVIGGSDDGEQRWLNWVVRNHGGRAVGTLQATVVDGGARAEVAWITGRPDWAKGYASEAARAVVEWLMTTEVRSVQAHVHPDHLASAVVAERTGLRPTDTFHDGEQLWCWSQPGSPDPADGA